MLTARQLNAIHARAAAATPGPWEAHDCGDTCCQWITAHREERLFLDRLEQHGLLVRSEFADLVEKQ